MPEISENAELAGLYKTGKPQPQTLNRLSKNVYYLGFFQGFGPLIGQSKLFLRDYRLKQGLSYNLPKGAFLTQEHQEKALDLALESLKDCVVLCTTASYFTQFQSACLLKSRGFQLLDGRCYQHPNYISQTLQEQEHPGIPDRRCHWEHVWWKVIGHPEELGLNTQEGLNNCGVDRVQDLEECKLHDTNDRAKFMAVAWMPRGTLFPKGWKRFYAAKDYKLGHNFDLTSASKCAHNFDLAIFKDWKPDFNKWRLD